jgi:cell division septation protein DedD
MKRIEKIIVALSLMSALSLYGCASSEESSDNKDTGSSSSTQKSEPPVPAKVDTVHVGNVQTSPKPTYESSPTTSSTGNSAVQIGAFKLQEGAERAASVARERFAKDVMIVTDRINNLFKVLVGNFAVKDEARRFRDEILQKYPVEYKDAWVTEIPQK